MTIIKQAARLKAILQNKTEGIPAELGRLNADGSYTVRVEDTTDENYARLYGDKNQLVTCLNHQTDYRSRLPVRVTVNRAGRYVVLGTDESKARIFMGEAAPTANLPPLVGTELKLIVPGDKFQPGRVRPLNGTDLLAYMEKLNWSTSVLGDTSLDLTTVVGTIASGKKAWIVMSINPNTNTLSATKGTDVSLPITLTVPDAMAVAIPSGDIRLWGFILKQGDTTFATLPLTADGIYQADLRTFVQPGLIVQEIDGSPSVAFLQKLKVSNGSLTDNGDGSATLAVGSGTVTNVTATSPLASSGGATPDISLSGVVDQNHIASPMKLRAVVVATTNISVSSAPASIDSAFPVTGDRILLAGQTSGAENGLWVYNGTGNALTRPNDYASGNTVQAFAGIMIYITAGTEWTGSFWRLTSPSTTITIDTTSTSWQAQPGTFRGTLALMSTGGFLAKFLHSNTADRGYTLSDTSDIIVLQDYTQTLTNKKFNDGITVNDSAGATGDFNVKGDTNNNLIFADVSADALGIGTNAPDASTILHVSSTTKASLPAPSMTAAQRDAISSPIEGDMVYVNDTDEHWFYDGQRWRAVGSVGWTPYAYPLIFDMLSAYGTALALAANGGSIALPVNVPSHMLLQDVQIVNTDTSLNRTWGWDLYRQYLNNGNSGENTLTRVVASNGSENFTAAAISVRTLAATSAPVYLAPGIYWLVIQCRHATQNFGLGRSASSTNFAPNTTQTKTTTNPNGSSIDLHTGWSKRTDIVAARLDGRVFGESVAF